MSVFSQLFRKKQPVQKTLEQRVDELVLMDEDQQRVAIISGDDDALRLGAIDRASFAQAITLAFDDNLANKLQFQARKRVAALIDSGEASVEQLVEKRPVPTQQLLVLELCQHSQWLTQVLEHSVDQDLLFTLATAAALAQVRQMAANKIDDPGQLKALLKHSKNKDKAVFKIARDKLNQQRELLLQQQATQESIEQFIPRLENFSRKDFDKLYRATLGQLLEHWQGYAASASDEQRARVSTLQECCNDVITEHHQQQQIIDEQAVAVASAPQQQQQLLAEMAALLNSLFELAAVEPQLEAEVEAPLALLSSRWTDIEVYAAASKADRTLFSSLSEAVKTQLRLTVNEGCLTSALEALRLAQTTPNPAVAEVAEVSVAVLVDASVAEAAEQPLALAELQTSGVDSHRDDSSRSIDDHYVLLQRHLHHATALTAAQLSPNVLSGREYLAQHQRASREKINDEKAKLRQITALARRAEAAINEGASGPAAGLRRSIEEKLLLLERQPESLQRQLELLDQSLDKLLDWKNYAVAPKKQELVDAMTLLVDSAENPEAVAVKIKRLQGQWKALSKGGRDQDASQWQHFQQLANKAYEPCKTFYRDEALARGENLNNRTQLVQQLQNYIALQGWAGLEPVEPGAETAPMAFKEVEKILSTALIQWQQYAPVDRSAGRSVQAQFDQQLSLIRGQLQRGYEHNRQEKQQLVTAAEGLLLLEDHRRATTEVKALQAQWKTVGPASQRDDHKLWKAFRSSCDGVFERREQQVESFKAQLEDNKRQAEALSSELQGLAQLIDQALLDSRGRADEISGEFNRLDGLPKASSQSINRIFTAAQVLFQQAISRQRAGAKERVWTVLLDAADSIRLFQLQQLEDSEPNATAQQALHDSIEALTQLPKNGARHLLDKLHSQPMAQEVAANELQLRALCIRAEILSAQDTPAEDQSQRMAMQVERLKTDFGQESADGQGQLNALVFDWVDCGPVASEQYQPLLQRFLRCRAHS